MIIAFIFGIFSKEISWQDWPVCWPCSQEYHRHFPCTVCVPVCRAAATDLSTYLLLGIDFAINMYFTGKVFWLFRKKEFAKCGETLQGLVVNEFLEFTMPFLFLVCFLTAFHGPNADIIGIKYKVLAQDKTLIFQEMSKMSIFILTPLPISMALLGSFYCWFLLMLYLSWLQPLS